MRSTVRKLFGLAGYNIKRKSPEDTFHSEYYLRHNARRLEHLASLQIPIAGMSVLEVGAGIGDHTTYFLDRGCDVTSTEARAENIALFTLRYPSARIFRLDVERPEPVPGAPFDVVHCYGLLYHLRDPQSALAFISQQCRKILFLETCVSFGAEAAVNSVAEELTDPSQAFSGTGCRPTRAWIFAELQRHFSFVYCSKTQPNHEDFPLDWTAPEKHHSSHGVQRSVFIASRAPIDNENLSPHLLTLQTRQA